MEGRVKKLGRGRRQSEKQTRGHMSRCRGETTSRVRKLMLTDGQAEAALEFVLLVVEEGSHG